VRATEYQQEEMPPAGNRNDLRVRGANVSDEIYTEGEFEDCNYLFDAVDEGRSKNISEIMQHISMCSDCKESLRVEMNYKLHTGKVLGYERYEGDDVEGFVRQWIAIRAGYFEALEFSWDELARKMADPKVALKVADLVKSQNCLISQIEYKSPHIIRSKSVDMLGRELRKIFDLIGPSAYKALTGDDQVEETVRRWAVGLSV
jgi:hypothetical protein